MIDKKSRKIICTAFAKGKVHDFRLFKESRTYFAHSTRVLADSGYQGLDTIHTLTHLPIKKSSLQCLTAQDKRHNHQLSAQRALNENIIGCIKRFKIVADRYRNRRKRFKLRFNLIAALYNLGIIL